MTIIIVASRKNSLDPIMISHCQGDDTIVAFQPMGIFCFWRNGEFTFSKDVYSLSIYVSPHPYPVKSSVLHWRPDLLWFYLHVQWLNKNRGLWTVYTAKIYLSTCEIPDTTYNITVGIDNLTIRSYTLNSEHVHTTLLWDYPEQFLHQFVTLILPIEPLHVCFSQFHSFCMADFW